MLVIQHLRSILSPWKYRKIISTVKLHFWSQTWIKTLPSSSRDLNASLDGNLYKHFKFVDLRRIMLWLLLAVHKPYNWKILNSYGNDWKLKFFYFKFVYKLLTPELTKNEWSQCKLYVHAELHDSCSFCKIFFIDPRQENARHEILLLLLLFQLHEVVLCLYAELRIYLNNI